MVKEGDHPSLKEAVAKELDSKNINLPPPSMVQLPHLDEQEQLNEYEWPEDLHFTVKPDLANSRVAFSMLKANLGCDEDDEQNLMTMMEGVPHDPLKPRPTPFDGMDLWSLWGDPSSNQEGQKAKSKEGQEEEAKKKEE